jgi:hypothetical protein
MRSGNSLPWLRLPDVELRAYALIEQLVHQQAVLLSYIDVFALCAVIALVLLPVPFMSLMPQPQNH